MTARAPERHQTPTSHHPAGFPSGNSVGAIIARRRALVLGLLGALTAALAWPAVTEQPTGYASYLPSGEATRAQLALDEELAPAAHPFVTLVEAREGDALAPAVLRELAANAATVRSSSVSESLAGVEVEGVRRVGVVTIADAVDEALRATGIAGGLDDATDAQLAAAVSTVVDARGPEVWGLAHDASRTPDGGWTSPSIDFMVAIDNRAVGGGVALGEPGTADDGREAVARQIEILVRGEQATFRAWVVGADPDLTVTEQGDAAAPYVAAAVMVLLLVLALAHRSLWVVAAGGAAALSLLVWVLAAARLVGSGRDQLVRIAAPVVVMAFASVVLIHVLGRTRSRAGEHPLVAFADGFSAVLGQVLAATAPLMAVGLAAAVSGIAAIRDFGIVVIIGGLAALLLAGVGAPLTVATVEHLSGRRRIGPRRAGGDLLPMLAALAAAGAIAWALAGASPAVGAAGLAFYVWLALAAPAQRMGPAATTPPSSGGPASAGRLLASAVRLPASVPLLTLTLVLAATGWAGWSASRILVDPGAGSLLDPAGDVAVAAERFEEHTGRTSEDGVSVLVEGDFTSPQSLAALRRFLDGVDESGGDMFARDAQGRVVVDRGVLDVVDGAEGEDADTSSRGGVRAVLEQAVDEESTAASAGGTRMAVARAPDGGRYVTALHLQLGSSGLAPARQARRLLEPMIADLAVDLRSADDRADVRLAGTALVALERAETLVTTTWLGVTIVTAVTALVAGVAVRRLRLVIGLAALTAAAGVWVPAIATILDHPLGLAVAPGTLVAAGLTASIALPFAARLVEERPGADDEVHAVELAAGATGGPTLAAGVAAAGALSTLGLLPVPALASFGAVAGAGTGLAVLGALLVPPSAFTLRARRAVVARLSAGMFDPSESDTPEPVPQPAQGAAPAGRRRPIDEVPAVGVLRPEETVHPEELAPFSDPGRNRQATPDAPFPEVGAEPARGTAVEAPVVPVEAVADDDLEVPEVVGGPDLVVTVAPDGSWVDIRLDETGRSYVGRGAANPQGIVEAMVTVIAARSGRPSPDVLDVRMTHDPTERLEVVLAHDDGRRTHGSALRRGSMTDALLEAVTRAMDRENQAAGA